MVWLLLAAAILAMLGIWLLIRARSMRRAAGLPMGRVAYVDTGAWDRCEHPLFSDRYRLTGRPDYLVQSRDGILPVEVKTGTAPEQPYPAHLLQLAAYCLLVEDQEGRRPTYGIIKYDDRAFEVDYTPSLRAELLHTLEAIRHDLHAHDVKRSHDEAARCLGCGYRDRCEQRLT
jgi:CRISPR-associated exonuclease Cas4